MVLEVTDLEIVVDQDLLEGTLAQEGLVDLLQLELPLLAMVIRGDRVEVEEAEEMEEIQMDHREVAAVAPVVVVDGVVLAAAAPVDLRATLEIQELQEIQEVRELQVD